MHASAFTLELPIVPPLDPAFLPASVIRENYRRQVRDCDHPEALHIAIEREQGCVHRDLLALLPPNPVTDPDTFELVERHLKTLLWAHGGHTVYLSGPANLCETIGRIYAPGGARAFDVDLMGRVYDRSFSVRRVEPEAIPDARISPARIGAHLDGCRVGFDLGASDYKLAAVREGTAVFSTEIPWQPAVEPDPAYHYRCIIDGIRAAAAHLPRLDAVGGSAAGIYIDNRVKTASLFRAVPEARFQSDVRHLFVRLQAELGVPLTVVNDGDVTALAGALSLKRNAMLGIAMGSSEAAGYLDPQGRIRGSLNELAFVPVDYQADGGRDEWSGDTGVGAQYFSQQAINRLALKAGMAFGPDQPLRERLTTVQQRMAVGDPVARRIFETIGVYLGYALPLYGEFYDFRDVLILGRVTSGAGGEVILSEARRVLETVFPSFVERVRLNVPDEASRRVGQAVAAASLPALEP